tara:strand:+ start:2994 stop:3263 length:270 start_codon:yes stop_codon:yes gene_type:complete
MSDKEFIEEVYEIAFGGDAINRDFSYEEVLEELRDNSDKAWGITKPRIKELIKEFVDDHKAHFHCYPMEVEVNDVVYSWDQYWEILDND